jgi:F0F1-type ATP synthase delta subunit
MLQAKAQHQINKWQLQEYLREHQTSRQDKKNLVNSVMEKALEE